MSDSVGPAQFCCAMSLLSVLASPASYSQPPVCEVQSGRVSSIRLGESIDQVFRAYQNDFEIVEVKPRTSTDPLIPQGPHLFNVVEKSSKRKWIGFWVDEEKKILEAYITAGPCATKEGIRVGSTLGQAISAYGRPELSPADVGYFVGFEKLPGIAFLLNDSDIPKRLRGIPDDELAAKQEREIVSYRRARIIEILVMRPAQNSR